ncbi:pilus assembly protein PilP [Teredinibacter waterburyi]|jgi:Tfp pilus assembly protein PilP|uniref:pilus assembly protein PilP n=1 Tax=Teredinibacter waterburyi TaxID=1500538 RepID=UPI00165F9197|nr:pilus assembly protein PilP [Teredinibacter waterburyi]
MNILLRTSGPLIFVMLLAGCGAGDEYEDLQQYITEIRKRPAGKIEEPPTFRPFEAFVYATAANRSPFDRPVDIAQRIVLSSGESVKPDLNREKEYLEKFDLSALAMVGTLEKDGTLWALIADSSGVIFPVTTGNYIGTNHGKIVETDESKIEILEIVSDGLEGWLERPSVLAITEKD